MEAQHVVATLCTMLVLAVLAPSASAAVKSLESFKTEVDVYMTLKQRSIWDGIYPGCHAPQEKFEQNYTLKYDSKPSSKAKIKPGTATIFPGSYGATASYGAKGSASQTGKPGQWELQVANPAGCSFAAPAPPAWATSPGCKKISERVMATIVGGSAQGEGGRASDGSIILQRVKKASASSKGGSIGASCWRTLHDVHLAGIDQTVDINQTSTFVQIPVKNLLSKLSKLADGGAKSKPSFNVPFKLSGDCNSATMKPSTGTKQSITPIIGSIPHSALGHIFDQPQRSTCMISGSGTIRVRRVGATKRTLVPAAATTGPAWPFP